MADISIFDLPDVGGPPVAADVIPFVDTTDTSESPEGTTKKMTVAELFTRPTLVTPVLFGTLPSGVTAPLVLSDGTTGAGSSGVPTGTDVGTWVSATVSAATVDQYCGYALLKVTTAGAHNISTQRAHAWATHTSGTVTAIQALTAVAEAGGNGGTVGAANAIIAAVSASTGATITEARGLLIGVQSSTGTIGTLVGIQIGAMTAGATNYAIRTDSGNILFGSLPTSSAGLAAGCLWNNSGVIHIV